jgi:hypothetical protein
MRCLSGLSPSEHSLLADAVETHRPGLRPLVDELAAGERRLSAEEGNALRDAVTEELARAGFDGEYVPTNRGRALEELIDRLGHVTAVFD